MATILDGLVYIYSLLKAMIDKKADSTAMTGATTKAAGKTGLVPAPVAGAATRYLCSDGTWQVPPDTDTVYTHPTTAGNKHIPSGGSSGQVLKWKADGEAQWDTDNDTKITVDSAMSSSSTNPVQNKAVYAALAEKSGTGHGHTTADLTSSESTPLANDLYIVKGSPSLRLKHTNGSGMVFQQGTNQAFFMNQNVFGDNDDYRSLQINNSALYSSLVNALRLTDRVGGVSTQYRIFHEGNIADLGGCRIAIGSYTGTGTYGSANPNSLTFDFTPKVVVIMDMQSDASTSLAIFINNINYAYNQGSRQVGYLARVTFSGGTVTWYTTAADDNAPAAAQGNYSGRAYRYFALG